MDWRFNFRGELTLPVDSNGDPIKVTYVDFDAETVSLVGERPWDRNFLADVANILLDSKYGNANSVGFDFIFSSQSMSLMVPPENVLRSDSAIGDLLEKHPNRVVVATAYSEIRDRTYMSKKSSQPYRVSNKTKELTEYIDPQMNPFPEMPTYPIVKYKDGKNIGKVGIINFDVQRSNGPTSRFVPAYFEYKGPAYSLNILHGQLKAYSILEGLNAQLQPLHNDTLHHALVKMNDDGSSGEILAQLKADKDDFILVDANGDLLDIENNRMPQVIEKTFYHISIQLVLAYLGLDEDAVEFGVNREFLNIVNEGQTLLTIPLIDQQVMEINWFSRWTTPSTIKTPAYIPPLITSTVNPRCSIRDVLAFFAQSNKAETVLEKYGASSAIIRNEIKKWGNELEEASSSILQTEALIEKNPALATAVATPLKNAYARKDQAENVLAQLTEIAKDPTGYALSELDAIKKGTNGDIAEIENMIKQNPAFASSVKQPLKNAKERKVTTIIQIEELKTAINNKNESNLFFKNLNNSIILIGPVDPIFQDIASTPFDKINVPKVSVHGNMIKTIFSNQFIKRLPNWFEYAAILMLGSFIAFLVSYNGAHGHHARYAGIATQAIYIALVFYLFKQSQLVIPLIAPIGACASVSFLGIAIMVILEKKQKGKIKGMFGSYVSPELVDQMINSESEPSLGGIDTEITAFFSDVQSFSTFSELLSSPQLVDLMNEYLTAMTNILQSEQGTLDKYIGDAIVAMFGAPINMKDHAYRSARTSILMYHRQIELREKWKSEGNKWPDCVSNMQTRIGMNTGMATVGNMGAENRFNYTMMGDMVNLAARCESGAKAFGAYIMVTEGSRDASVKFKDDILFRYLDKIIVKGRSIPVSMYEIFGFKDDLEQRIIDCEEITQQASGKYLAQDWDAAIKLYTEAQEYEMHRPGITPGVKENLSTIFIDRCHQMKENPPGKDWDGVFIMTSK